MYSFLSIIVICVTLAYIVTWTEPKINIVIKHTHENIHPPVQPLSREQEIELEKHKKQEAEAMGAISKAINLMNGGAKRG